MVRQESPVASTANGGGQLHRSSWKAEAIRRGDLKISGPIPITEDIPLNEEEEKEYAAKHNIETAPENPDTPTQQQLGPKRSLNAGSQHTAPDKVEVQQPEVQENPHQLRHKRSSTGIRAISEMQRHTSPDLSASYNSPSPFPSLPDSASKMTPRKKRGSGLRNVFRKMFGRKDKEAQEDSFQKHGYHRSDPGILTHPPEKPKENVSTAPRISDLQVRDLQPINPLGSHLPFPMNVNAPEQASPPHEYLTFDPPPTIGRRRATLPSVILSPAEAQALAATWGSSGTKVTVWDEQHPKQTESIPSPEIGVALSSPKTSPIHKKHNRRSRSAGALRDLGRKQESASRRRSAEIRYWRTSAADRSVSVYSSHTPRPQTAETAETPKEIPRDVAEAPPEPIFPVSPEPIDQEEKIISPIPVEAFNFGNLNLSGFSTDPGEEDVPPSTGPRLSLEERIKLLEDRTQGLESSMHRLTGRSNRQTIILESAPKGRRSDRSSSTTRDGNGSRKSSKSSHKTLSSKQESTSSPSPTQPPTFLSSPSTAGDGTDKITPFPGPSNTRSLTAQDSNPLEPSAMPKPTASTQSQSLDPSEQYAAVYAVLRHERSARKALEKQVMSLQRELTDLRSLVQKFVTTSAYPTPSPDAIIQSSAEERLSTPRASRRPPARGLGFESEEESGTIYKRRVPERERVVSRFSVDSEGGDGREEEGGGGVSGSSKEDVTSPDVWATPREETGYGFFGRDAEDEMF